MESKRGLWSLIFIAVFIGAMALLSTTTQVNTPSVIAIPNGDSRNTVIEQNQPVVEGESSRSVAPTAASRISKAQVSESASAAPARQIIEQRQARVEELSARLAQLQDQAETLNREMSEQNSSQSIQENQMQLNFLLQSLSRAEEQVQRQVQDALNNQSSLFQNQYQEMERAIQDQTQQITQTQNELNYWNQPQYDLTLQQTRLIELNDLLNQQTAQLENLKQQRFNIANSIISGKEQIQQEREVALQGIQLQKQELQIESQSLSSELMQSQQSQWKGQSNLDRLRDQIRQTQQALQKAETQVQQQEQRQLQQSEVIVQ